MDKISKFDSTLSVENARQLRFRGFPRRMQWRLAYRDDVKELRSKLGSFVATINLLLMTQTVASVTAGEGATCGLQTKILENRKRLNHIEIVVESTFSRQFKMISQLDIQGESIHGLALLTETTSSQLYSQHELIEEVKTLNLENANQTKSLLALATDTLYRASLSLLTLRDIAVQIADIFACLIRFTGEMRETLALTMAHFGRIYRILERLETNLTLRVCPPIIRFTDALGVDFALPYQACLHWDSMQMIVKAIFEGRPGKPRVERGMFRINNAKTGMILRKQNSERVPIKENDYIEMSMVFKSQPIGNCFCPFSGCHNPLVHSGDSDDQLVCQTCGCSLELSAYTEDENRHLSDDNMTEIYSEKDQHDHGDVSKQDITSCRMKRPGQNIERYRKVTIQHVLACELIGGYIASLKVNHIINKLIFIRESLFPEFSQEISAVIDSMTYLVKLLHSVSQLLTIFPHNSPLGFSYGLRTGPAIYRTMRDMLLYDDVTLSPRSQWVMLNQKMASQDGMSLSNRFKLFQALWTQVIHAIIGWVFRKSREVCKAKCRFRNKKHDPILFEQLSEQNARLRAAQGIPGKL